MSNMMELRFNVNVTVKVKLTSVGYTRMVEYFGGEKRSPRADLREYREFNLWELMSCFGPLMYNGQTHPPFFDNEVLIER
jgi:hypothetical protein